MRNCARKISVLLCCFIVALVVVACDDTEIIEESVVTEENMEETEIEIEVEEAVGLEEDVESEESSELVRTTDGGDFGRFTTTTIAGEEVTNGIFSEYELTMVNIWATWCSPCVEEMDELQEVYEGMDDNTNLISICYDGNSAGDTAKQILEANGVTFDTLLPNGDIESNIFGTIQYFPTTIFIDSNGNIIGEYLEGAPSYDAVNTYNSIIESYRELLD